MRGTGGQVVHYPLDVFRIVDMECVVEHGGFDGELSHKVLFGILGDTQPVELFAVGGAVGMGGDGSPVVAYAHGSAGVEVDDDPVAAAGGGHALGVDELEVAEGKEAVGAP